MKKCYLILLRHTKRLGAMALLVLAWIYLNLFGRQLYRKDCWLLCEKRNEARDNGYHFYKYLKNVHPEINSYFVITKDSPDFGKVEALGNVVIANSFKHCLLYLAAKYSISSQPYGAYPFSFSQLYLRAVNRLCRPDQKTVFLQHGITKAELAHKAFDYDKCNIDFFVCSAPEEYAFVKSRYGYPEGAIACVGMCRFDYLLNPMEEIENTVLVMPTWRMWLRRNIDGIPLNQSEIQNFKASDFYKQYSSMLTDERILTSLRKKNLKIVFYLHYQLQDYTPLFKEFENDVVVIADRYQYDVQKLLITSKVLVTDYSSVYFDFAYMNKPLVHFLFDKNRFEGSHYAKGYFEYERDGFGPCTYTLDGVVNALTECIEHNCVQSQQYSERVDGFFMERDGRNCERTFQMISRL